MTQRIIRTIAIVGVGLLVYLAVMDYSGLSKLAIALLWLPTYAALVGVDSLVRRWVGD